MKIGDLPAQMRAQAAAQAAAERAAIVRRHHAHPEHDLQSAIVRSLRPKLLPGARMLALNGELPGGREQVLRAARRKAAGYERGTPDLAVFYGGRCGFLEVKTDQGRLTPEQRLFRDWAMHEGFAHAVVRSVGQAAEELAAWGMVQP